MLEPKSLAAPASLPYPLVAYALGAYALLAAYVLGAYALLGAGFGRLGLGFRVCPARASVCPAPAAPAAAAAAPPDPQDPPPPSCGSVAFAARGSTEPSETRAVLVLALMGTSLATAAFALVPTPVRATPILLRPKSVSLRWPLAAMRRLSGLTSRWMIPRS